MQFTGERFIPNISGEEIEIEHVQRYIFAKEAVKGKIVLDAACGEGYGSNLLSLNAEMVYGIDISEEAIQHASEKYGGRNRKYICASIDSIPLPDNSIDCVVSFETIEHVGEELQQKFLSEIKRVLKADGYLIMSTPNKSVYTDEFNQKNEFHIKEFYYEEYLDFLKKYFKESTVFAQYFEICANIDLPDNGIAIKTSNFKRENAKYIIALCSDEKKNINELLQSSVYVLGNNQYSQRIHRILNLQDEVEEKNNHIKNLESLLSHTSEQYGNMRIQKEQYEQLYYNYKRELDAIIASPRWKLMQKASNLRMKILPPNTKRIELFKKVFKKNKKSGNVNSIFFQKKYHPIAIPVFDKPKVSIIIPVYNHFEYTYACIKSIVANTQEIPYEIILGDDRSKDKTREADRYFQNAVIIRNDTNLGFLRNCNHAAAYAKGEYIHFLNNDTMVNPGWIIPLVNLLDNRKDIGLAGSKLLNSNESLQEAGGIIWKDASGWNFGLGQDPANSEFNYVKEVDYISGASIMVRKSLWQDIGGFDEKYAPAYFEDSDFAFEVRRHGRKVVYQPLSEVVHFEGVSNGRDLSSGVKSYQLINRDKFIEKWKDVLKAEHFNNGESVFWARDRSRNKKTILVIDHFVPLFDQDAGSRAIFGYLKLFLDMGLNVKFMGDNFSKMGPYASTLEQLGIEVLYGPKYSAENWQNWMLENKDYIDLVMLSRPHISIKYIDFIKDHMHAKILYLGHDFHYMRELREYEITHDEKLLASSNDWRKKEYYLMSHADRVLMVSDFEKVEIKKAFNVDIDVIPIYYFNQFIEDEIDFSAKKDLLFVGGFNHRPNMDGLLWFLDEVWPTVTKSLPDVALNIVGSNIPESLKERECGNIHIKGFLPDEELAEQYRTCRVCIVPLRYGAGIKGKVIEAMYNRVSIVSTEIGIEGLASIQEIIRPANDAQSFSSQIMEKYKNEETLKKDSMAYLHYLKEHFSYEYAKGLFETLLGV